MKYVMYWEWKDAESTGKASEVEKERRKKGETLDKKGELIGQYISLNPYKWFQIIETDDVSIITKWTIAYANLYKNLKIMPVLTREEFEEARK